MLSNKSILFIVCFLIGSNLTVFAQQISKFELLLKSGTIIPNENIDEIGGQQSSARKEHSDFKILRIIQFTKIPSADQIDSLKNEGVELIDYIPNNAYTALINRTISQNILQRFGIRALVKLTPEQKIEHRVLNAVDFSNGSSLDLRIKYIKLFSWEEVKIELVKRGIKIISEVSITNNTVDIIAEKAIVKELASQEFIEYIAIPPGETKPLNDNSVAFTRANIIASGNSLSTQLDGNGVVVGVGDNANPLTHFDFNSRILNYETLPNQSHGVHVIGTIAGAGLINEKYKGYAPRSTIVARGNDHIFKEADGLVSDFGMVLTNNSYSSGYGDETCYALGQYYGDAYDLDCQASTLPNLLHIFAAGNSGLKNVCDMYPAGFGTVLSDMASAKNVISVGFTLPSGLIAAESSKGPVKDGRIKPEIVAPGTRIYSTYPNDQYRALSGTSMAAAAVTGGMTLLYQKYRQLNDQTNPKNGLMKALLCNGAEDQGLPGPDFTYGFGMVNLSRSAAMLDQKHYFSGKLGNGNSASHMIQVPKNIASLKVMLYWNDPGSSFYNAKTLINDLDLTVSGPQGEKNYPVFPSADKTDSAAKPGIDNTNNIEQVVIQNPLEGQYTFEINGKLIPQGVQEYFVVYDPIPVSSKLTYPVGREHFSNDDVIYISWDSYGNTSNTFKIEYSKDNGQSWTAIANAVPAKERQIEWNIPNVATENAKVRITQNETGWTEQSESFTILGVPLVSLSAVQCESYISIDWTPVDGASDYEIMWVKDDQMKTVAITKALKFTFDGLSKDSSYVISVRARKNEIPGRRSIAITRTPNSGSCAGNISDGDLMIESIVNPAESGRLHTVSQLSAEQSITIKIKNLDDQVSDKPFSVGYSTGEIKKDIIWETINPVIKNSESYEYTFRSKARMDALGAYNLTIYIDKPSDLVKTNNVVSKKVLQLDNAPLALPFFDDFENLPSQEILFGLKGLSGSDRYDFASTTTRGRLRTTVKPGIAFSGVNALTMDVNHQTTGNTNYIISTYNLSNYSAAKDELILTYLCRVHEANQSLEPIYIRGSESDPWITVSPNVNAENLKNGYNSIRITLSEILKQNKKEFGPSVQIKWQRAANDVVLSLSKRQGLSIDDILIEQIKSDVAVTDVQIPEMSCFQKTVKVAVMLTYSGDKKLSSTPVKARISNKLLADGVAYFASNETANFEFYISQSDLMAGKQVLKVWTEQTYDINRTNDTLAVEVKIPEVITTFPYLQDFEQGQGDWRASGVNSSWAYGSPNSQKIKSAASGKKAWKTNLTGNYNNNELSYLYSPCFNTTTMKNPMMSFSTSLDFETDGSYDVAYVEYQINENPWYILDSEKSGVNWYNVGKFYYGERFWNFKDYTRWHVSSTPLPRANTIRFRFVVRTNDNTTREGLAIDDIHIYDQTNEIYSSQSASNEIVYSSQTSNNSVIFTDQNQVFASLMSTDAQVGTVKARTYLSAEKSPNNNGQYYLKRNFTIKSSTKDLIRFATLRLYFTDQEVEELLGASGCATCENPSSAYDLSISNYIADDSDKEDGSINNNNMGKWTFYERSKIKIVPYGKGYYAEFPSTTLSEFWLSKNKLGGPSPLPVNLIHFSARKKPSTADHYPVILEWVTDGEKNFSHFEVEAAFSLNDLHSGNFIKLTDIPASKISNTQNAYSYLHYDAKKTGVNYYRLKMVDLDSSFQYSLVKSITLDQLSESIVYPNPSNGTFELDFKTVSGKKVNAKIYDSKGNIMKRVSWIPDLSTGIIRFELRSPEFTPGEYILETVEENSRQIFKIVIN